MSPTWILAIRRNTFCDLQNKFYVITWSFHKRWLKFKLSHRWWARLLAQWHICIFKYQPRLSWHFFVWFSAADWMRPRTNGILLFWLRAVEQMTSWIIRLSSRSLRWEFLLQNFNLGVSQILMLIGSDQSFFCSLAHEAAFCPFLWLWTRNLSLLVFFLANKYVFNLIH